MKKLLAAAVSLGLVSHAAFAGLSQPAQVEVDLENSLAQGDMLTAALSKSQNVFIGCGTRNFEVGTEDVFVLGFCQAEDAAGEAIVCTTQNPGLVQAIRAISDFSYIQFRWDESGQCTNIGISTQSFYIDKPK